MYYLTPHQGFSKQYADLRFSVYSHFDGQSVYAGSHIQEPVYKALKEESLPKQREEHTDVIRVKDQVFDLFLKHSPLLRDLASKEVRELYKDFLKGKGKYLLKFLKDKGRQFIALEGFARMKLDPNALAAVIRSGDRAILSVNTNFDEMAYDFAKHHGISLKEAVLYVFAHETVHLADESSEPKTETLVGDWFLHLAKEEPAFEKLKSIAYGRAKV